MNSPRAMKVRGETYSRLKGVRRACRYKQTDNAGARRGGNDRSGPVETKKRSARSHLRTFAAE